MGFDLQYICVSIGNLSGIPVRLYEGKKEVLFHSVARLPRDPMVVYKDEILEIQDHISYFATETLNYYGIFNVDDKKIILGPTRLVPNTDQELRHMAFLADVPKEETEMFISGMKAIVGLPQERLIQMLCLLNYFFHKEKVSLKDITIYETEQEALQKHIVLEEADESIFPFYRRVNNTFTAENTMLDLVSKGDVAILQEWLQKGAVVQSAVLAADPIRQAKNTFISSVTLISRSAIRGGMEPGDANNLANDYIQKCELLNQAESIANLQYHALQDFTERVNQLRFGSDRSKLVIDVVNYVQHHISLPVTTQEIADALFLSRPHLSKRFKDESGVTLKEFIWIQKIEEAKRLLKYTDKSLLAISVYLGFSSQSHFTHIFKNLVGKTPGEYRSEMF